MKDKYKIAVIGLGYVGLPLAKSFSKHFHTIGYDVNHNLINNLKSKESSSLDFSKNSVLILGYTFKENCEGIINSKVLNI